MQAKSTQCVYGCLHDVLQISVFLKLQVNAILFNRRHMIYVQSLLVFLLFSLKFQFYS
jgi:hypothetical protein